MRSILAGLRTLILPWGARKGQPRIVIGPDLPAPLNTYIVQPWGVGFASAIVFYPGTPSDDDYMFIATIKTGGAAAAVYIGGVMNGLMSERTPGFPAGINWSLFSNLQLDTFFDLSSTVAGVGSVRMGSDATVNDGELLPTIPLDQVEQYTPAGLIAINNAVYAPLGAAASITLIKLHDNTAVKIKVAGGGFASGIGPPATRVEFGLRLNGVTYTAGQFLWNTASEHHMFEGEAIVPASIPSGTYNPVELMIRRATGVANANTDQSDTWSYSIEEVNP